MDNSLAALAEKAGNGSPTHLQRLEFLVSTVPVVIHTCKAEGDFSATFVSDGVRALWGYEPGDFLNNNRFWSDRLHPEDADRAVAGLSVVLTAGHYGHEYRFRSRSGEYRWVRDELRLLRGASGEPLEIVGHCIDITDRKCSEDKAAFLASIVQSSEDSIVGNGLDGIILSWNASSERFWGYTSEEVTGQHVKILFPPERADEFAKNIERIHRDIPIKRFESVRVRKDGSRVPVSIILSPVKDPQGKLLGVAAIYRDLTARKQVESQLLAATRAAEASAASLRASEERYALATQATYDGIFDWNLATGASYLSPRFKRILGYAADELPNDLETFIGRVHPEDREQVNGRISGEPSDVRTEPFEDEVRVCCKDGNFRWVASRGRLLRSPEGKPVRFIGSIRDITARKEAETKLAASEKRLRDILDSLYGFVGLYTLEGIVLYVNRAPLEAAGMADEDVVGKPFWELYSWSHSADERDRLRAAMARAAAGEMVRYEASVLIKGGRQIVIDATFGPLRDEQGRIVNVIGFGVDITARKEAETRLKLAIQVAEVASRAKSEFLANMSHEIRTPMNGIIGLTEVVLESALNPEQREYLSLVKTSADSLMTIIGDILDISKIQAGKVALHPKEFWIRDLITTTLNGFGRAAADKNLELICHIQPEIPDVLMGDPDCLRQILVNLLGNAIKFTPAGEVMLCLEISPTSPQHVHFSVHDSGIGIAADQRQRIFEPFTQLDGSSRREYGGTGLGLAISAQLVEMMDGEIWVVSDGRSGSTFHFTARLRPANATAEVADQAVVETTRVQTQQPDRALLRRRRLEANLPQVFRIA